MVEPVFSIGRGDLEQLGESRKKPNVSVDIERRVAAPFDAIGSLSLGDQVVALNTLASRTAQASETAEIAREKELDAIISAHPVGNNVSASFGGVPRL